LKRYPEAIVATCVIPWSDTGEFLEEQFRAEVRLLRKNLTRHLYIFGTAGEGYAVSERQFGTIAGVFREETRHADTTPMLGVISLSLPTIIERIELGRDLGYRQFQISLPAWGALNDREVDTFFRETCGRFADCAFLHYNLMRTKKLLTGDDYARLSSAHANLVAVKTGSDDRQFLTDIIVKAPELQLCLSEFGYAMLRDHHECSLLISLASANHRMAQEFFQARGEKLQTMGQEQHAILEALMASVNGEAHMDGAFDKLLYRLHDPNFPLRLLPPYTAATEEMFARFRESLPARWCPGEPVEAEV